MRAASRSVEAASGGSLMVGPPMIDAHGIVARPHSCRKASCKNSERKFYRAWMGKRFLGVSCPRCHEVAQLYTIPARLQPGRRRTPVVATHRQAHEHQP